LDSAGITSAATIYVIYVLTDRLLGPSYGHQTGLLAGSTVVHEGGSLHSYDDLFSTDATPQEE